MSQENGTKDNDLLTAVELAEWLDVPTGSIHALAARDAFPYVKPKKWNRLSSHRLHEEIRRPSQIVAMVRVDDRSREGDRIPIQIDGRPFRRSSLFWPQTAQTLRDITSVLMTVMRKFLAAATFEVKRRFGQGPLSSGRGSPAASLLTLPSSARELVQSPCGYPEVPAGFVGCRR
jgi:hypothetical protein